VSLTLSRSSWIACCLASSYHEAAVLQQRPRVAADFLDLCPWPSRTRPCTRGPHSTNVSSASRCRRLDDLAQYGVALSPPRRASGRSTLNGACGAGETDRFVLLGP